MILYFRWALDGYTTPWVRSYGDKEGIHRWAPDMKTPEMQWTLEVKFVADPDVGVPVIW